MKQFRVVDLFAGRVMTARSRTGFLSASADLWDAEQALEAAAQRIENGRESEGARP